MAPHQAQRASEPPLLCPLHVSNALCSAHYDASYSSVAILEQRAEEHERAAQHHPQGDQGVQAAQVPGTARGRSLACGRGTCMHPGLSISFS